MTILLIAQCIFLYFECIALRESAFQKMSKVAKQNWYCGKCKFTESSSKKARPMVTKVLEYKNMYTLFNASHETFKNLIESANFMSNKIDSFGKQMQELLMSIKYTKEKN